MRTTACGRINVSPVRGSDEHTQLYPSSVFDLVELKIRVIIRDDFQDLCAALCNDIGNAFFWDWMGVRSFCGVNLILN